MRTERSTLAASSCHASSTSSLSLRSPSSDTGGRTQSSSSMGESSPVAMRRCAAMFSMFSSRLPNDGRRPAGACTDTDERRDGGAEVPGVSAGVSPRVERALLLAPPWIEWGVTAPLWIACASA